MRPIFALAVLLCAAPLHAQTESFATPPPEPPAPTGEARHAFVFAFDGSLRFGLACIQPDGFCGVPGGGDADAERLAPFVGRNDGFVMGDARVNLRGTYGERLYVRLSVDGALAPESTSTDPVGRLETGLRDAYMRYAFTPATSLHVGRFKPPFDSEELTGTRDFFFVHRALESRGVQSHEGLAGELVGFRPGRQLGVMLGGNDVLSLGPIALGYALAVTNGNGGDATLNDNDRPAAWARATLTWGDEGQGVEVRSDEEGPATYSLREGGSVGLAAFYNEPTNGIAPNRFRDRVMGAGVDASLQYFVFVLRGQVLGQKVQHLLRDDSADLTALGGHVQLSARVIPSLGLYPGYRFAFYNPNRTAGDSTARDFAQVIHHTIGVRYGASTLPVMFFAEYTMSKEAAGRDTPNDRFEAAMQVDFE